MFIDASALVSILVEEEDASSLTAAIEAARTRYTSPIGLYETVTAVNRVHAGGIARARSRVDAFLERAGIAVVSVDHEAALKALDAYARFGKGQGHPAQLNMGDCFAYAMAKQHGVPLLYKGDEFALTDLA